MDKDLSISDLLKGKYIHLCQSIGSIVIIQCLAVFVGSATILNCIWSPDSAYNDYDKLARIMYLYDANSCGYQLIKYRSRADKKFSNNTFGLMVIPIKWSTPDISVSTRLSANTRNYIKLSIGIHVIWMITAIALMVTVFYRVSKIIIFKYAIGIFFYTSVSVVVYDLSMAILYIAHIQKSLTKGMVVRYSGWSINWAIKNPDQFAGWLPVVASFAWMRGVLIMAFNIYCCKKISFIRSKCEKREVTKRLVLEGNLPFPEPKFQPPKDGKVLYYRTGEYKPNFMTQGLRFFNFEVD